jgi:predicted AlkP superfamily pyrophosphatase or phosphodiesterase
MKFISFFLFLLWINPSWAVEPTPKVLIIGIDGCRPDALKAATAPNLDALIEAGTLFSGTDIREPEGTDNADTIKCDPRP